MSAEDVRDFYFILFRSLVINKDIKNLVSVTKSFLSFVNNLRSKENRTFPNTSL